MAVPLEREKKSGTDIQHSCFWGVLPKGLISAPFILDAWSLQITKESSVACCRARKAAVLQINTRGSKTLQTLLKEKPTNLSSWEISGRSPEMMLLKRFEKIFILPPLENLQPVEVTPLYEVISHKCIFKYTKHSKKITKHMNKQGNMAQSKEQSSELILKKQIYELPDKEFRIILLSSVYYKRTQRSR